MLKDSVQYLETLLADINDSRFRLQGLDVRLANAIVVNGPIPLPFAENTEEIERLVEAGQLMVAFDFRGGPNDTYLVLARPEGPYVDVVDGKLKERSDQ